MNLPLVDQVIRSRRKTVAILVRPDGKVIVRAPLRLSREKILAFVQSKAGWIAARKAEAQEIQQQVAHRKRRFAEGETFPVLGREYPLRLAGGPKTGLWFSEGFVLNSENLPQAAALFERWYRAMARKILTERTRFYAQTFGLTYQKLRISSAQTRWGSCSSHGTLSFTWRLVMAPLEVVDYVVVHELAHLRHPNHSAAFWAEVARMMPDYKTHRDWLKKNGRFLTLQQA